jgi:hypothetical protein
MPTQKYWFQISCQFLASFLLIFRFFPVNFSWVFPVNFWLLSCKFFRVFPVDFSRHSRQFYASFLSDVFVTGASVTWASVAWASVTWAFVTCASVSGVLASVFRSNLFWSSLSVSSSAELKAELMPELVQEKFSLLGVCRTERPENGGAGSLDGIVCWLTNVLEAIFGVAVSSLEVARPSILCCLKEREKTKKNIIA